MFSAGLRMEVGDTSAVTAVEERPVSLATPIQLQIAPSQYVLMAATLLECVCHLGCVSVRMAGEGRTAVSSVTNSKPTVSVQEMQVCTVCLWRGNGNVFTMHGSSLTLDRLPLSLVY